MFCWDRKLQSSQIDWLDLFRANPPPPRLLAVYWFVYQAVIECLSYIRVRYTDELNIIILCF